MNTAKWIGFTRSDLGVLIGRHDDSPEAALHAFCRALLYARDLGFNLHIKPPQDAETIEHIGGADNPPPLAQFVGDWPFTVMHNVLTWFNEVKNAEGELKVPQGCRVFLSGGNLVLQEYPAVAPTAEQAGLLFEVNRGHGLEEAAVKTVVLADQLGWGDTYRWRPIAWSSEWKDLSTHSNRSKDKLLAAANDAIWWMNSRDGVAPTGYRYRFDEKGVWLLPRHPRKPAGPTLEQAKRVANSPAMPIFSHADKT